MNNQEKIREVEEHNQKKFEYEHPVYGIDKNVSPEDYFRKLTDIRLGYLRRYGIGKKVLDVGCGAGDYLFEIEGDITQGCGVDFTDKAIDAANLKKRSLSSSKLDFIKANAKNLPFKEGSFDLVFSFSALAAVPQVEIAVKEIARVLKINGVAILEMGNRKSLNTIVCASYPEYTKPCHLKIKDMEKMLLDSHLKVMDWRSFGMLPFWAQRPGWLKPLLHPGWKKIFQKEYNGKMLDEWLSNMYFLKQWAYRHFIFCQRTEIP